LTELQLRFTHTVPLCGIGLIAGSWRCHYGWWIFHSGWILFAERIQRCGWV